MTSTEMLREFKVGIDKIDSSSYPEIYDEQIFMFINRFINNLVNAGRKAFEENQVITDNLKALLPAPVRLMATVDSTDNTKYNFSLVGLDYFFYIQSSARTSKGENLGKATTKVTQHDDIEIVLQDPYNKPKPYKIPLTFSKDTITGYTDGTFTITSLLLTYIKKPAKVSQLINCDLDEQLHYSIVEGAVELATQALGIRVEELNRD